MWRSLLIALLVGTASAGNYNLRNGLTDREWQGILMNTGGHIEGGYVVTQTIKTPRGDALVRWSSTPSLDPKGPHSLGLQWYGSDGVFRRWLPDAALIDRDLVLCGGRYLVGGGNTLRVWDAKKSFALITRRVTPDLPRFA